MKNITANKNKKTGNINAQVVLAEINAQIEALNQKRVTLAQPLKDRYAEMRGELTALETEIRSLATRGRLPGGAKSRAKWMEMALAGVGRQKVMERLMVFVRGE